MSTSVSVLTFNQFVGLEGDPAFRGYFFGRSPDGAEAFISVVNPGQQPHCRKSQQRGFPANKVVAVEEAPVRGRRTGGRTGPGK